MLTLCKKALCMESRHIGVLVTLLVCFYFSWTICPLTPVFFTSTYIVWIKQMSEPVEFFCEKWKLSNLMRAKLRASIYNTNILLFFLSIGADGTILHPDACIQNWGWAGDYFPTSSLTFYSPQMFEGSTSETRLHSDFLHFHRCCQDFTSSHFPPALLQQNSLSVLLVSIFIHYLNHCQI